MFDWGDLVCSVLLTAKSGQPVDTMLCEGVCTSHFLQASLVKPAEDVNYLLMGLVGELEVQIMQAAAVYSTS
jgi:hypothetical protein